MVLIFPLNGLNMLTIGFASSFTFFLYLGFFMTRRPVYLSMVVTIALLLRYYHSGHYHISETTFVYFGWRLMNIYFRRYV